jgi:hypothetical protein
MAGGDECDGRPAEGREAHQPHRDDVGGGRIPERPKERCPCGRVRLRRRANGYPVCSNTGIRALHMPPGASPSNAASSSGVRLVLAYHQDDTCDSPEGNPRSPGGGPDPGQTGAIGIALDMHLLYHQAEALCLPGLRIRFGMQKDFVITRARGRWV